MEGKITVWVVSEVFRGFKTSTQVENRKDKIERKPDRKGTIAYKGKRVSVQWKWSDYGEYQEAFIYVPSEVIKEEDYAQKTV